MKQFDTVSTNTMVDFYRQEIMAYTSSTLRAASEDT